MAMAESMVSVPAPYWLITKSELVAEGDGEEIAAARDFGNRRTVVTEEDRAASLGPAGRLEVVDQHARKFRTEERFADAQLHRPRLGIGEDFGQILRDRAARSDEEREDDQFVDAVGLGLLHGLLEDDRRLTAEQGRVDIRRMHRRDRSDFLADQPGGFLGQVAEG